MCVDPIGDNNHCNHTLVGNFCQHSSYQRPWRVDVRSDFISPTDFESVNTRCIAVFGVKSVVSFDMMVIRTCKEVHRWFDFEKAACAVEVKGVEFDVIAWM